MSVNEKRWPSSVANDLSGKSSEEAAHILRETRGGLALEYAVTRRSLAKDYFRADESMWWHDVAGRIRTAEDAERRRRRALAAA